MRNPHIPSRLITDPTHDMAGPEDEGTRTPQNPVRPISNFDGTRSARVPLAHEKTAPNGAGYSQYAAPRVWEDATRKQDAGRKPADGGPELRIPKLVPENEAHGLPARVRPAFVAEDRNADGHRSPRKRGDEGLSPEAILKKRMKRVRESLRRDLPPVSPPALPRLQRIGLEIGDASLEMENTELRAQLQAAKTEIDTLTLALRTEQAKHEDDLESVTDALHREYEQKLHSLASEYQDRITRRFENRISELLDMVESERLEKQALIDACDDYFKG